MKKHITLFLCVIAVLSSVPSFGWGQKGHDIVASVAERHLTKKTKKALDELLGGHTVVYFSSWMDNIQNSPYWKDGYNKTKTWHYANVDKGQTYQTMTQDPKGDVVKGLEMLTEQMVENYKDLTDSMRVDYVKMIVHMVGDLHCPMHAGRRTDRGGNKMKVKWFGKNTNLHSLWDSKLIESARSWSYTEWTDHLDIASKKEIKSLQQGTYEEWFAETVNRAAEIYDYVEAKGEENPNLSYQYIYDFSPVLEESLVVAGYRLAYVLNTIFN